MRTLVRVDPTPLAALTAGSVALVGLGYGLGRRGSRRDAGSSAADPDLPPVPEGVSEVLAVLGTGGLVLDSADLVVTSSAEAVRRGLVRRGELVHPELLALVRDARREAATIERSFELPVGGYAEAIASVRARAAPLGERHVLLIVDDRTESRRVDATRRDFVANVSHELKTPVGGIALLAEAVLDASDDPEAVQRFARRMKREADRLGLLVQEIVDLSRLQGQDILAASVPVDLGAAVTDALEMTRLNAEAKSIELVSLAEPGCVVIGDRDLLVTAVRNLVANAVAYSGENTRITVRTRRVGNRVDVAVTDQGRGIAAEDQERIFERFYRVDPARSRETGGTGLGLSIVKHICANHGGAVTVWSAEGRGSTFTIQLPAAGNEPSLTGNTLAASTRPSSRPHAQRGNR